MQSFRTSPWDPYEHLPRDYARIFQFEDFKRTERAVRRRTEAEADTVSVSLLLYAIHSRELTFPAVLGRNQSDCPSQRRAKGRC